MTVGGDFYSLTSWECVVCSKTNLEGKSNCEKSQDWKVQVVRHMACPPVLMTVVVLTTLSLFVLKNASTSEVGNWKSAVYLFSEQHEQIPTRTNLGPVGRVDSVQ